MELTWAEINNVSVFHRASLCIPVEHKWECGKPALSALMAIVCDYRWEVLIVYTQKGEMAPPVSEHVWKDGVGDWICYREIEVCTPPPNHAILVDLFHVFLPLVDHKTNWEFEIMGCQFGIIFIPTQAVRTVL